MIDLEQHWKDRAVVDGARLQVAIKTLQNGLIDINNARKMLEMSIYRPDGCPRFPIMLSKGETEIQSVCTSLENAIKNLNEHMASFVINKSLLFHKDYPEVYLADLITEMVNNLDDIVNKLDGKESK